ncbi:MAG: hypothetical protein JO210_11625, partial [Acidobacteriaceae bacterium]|nr:hypothetical protein [Acidobacteriaceae bacterium]
MALDPANRMRAVAYLLAFVSFALAAPSEFSQARDLYYQGVAGDKQAYEQADKLFAVLYQQASNNPRIRVYYGSLRLLQASRIWALWKKNGLSKEGIQLMDAAVNEAPG